MKHRNLTPGPWASHINNALCWPLETHVLARVTKCRKKCFWADEWRRGESPCPSTHDLHKLVKHIQVAATFSAAYLSWQIFTQGALPDATLKDLCLLPVSNQGPFICYTNV